MALFFRAPRPYTGGMIEEIGRVDRDTPPAVLNEEGPWGPGRDEVSGGGDDDAKRPRNPWTHPPRRKPRPPRGEAQPSLEELIRRARARFPGGLPSGGRPIWGYALAAFVLLWLATTSIHRIDPQQRGVITRFGRYAGTLDPGIGLTLPAPIDVVTRVNVDQIRDFDVPASGGQNLLLTRDGDLVSLSYSVRWSVRDPALFLFEMPGAPEDTLRTVAESAMREAVAKSSLDELAGSMQDTIEAQVTARLQALLDRYHAGVVVQGVAIRQAEPPAQVADAFKDVAAAQQAAQTATADAQRYADVAVAGAQGQATAFDKVYQAYKMAPQVTKTRMYYDTMEAVLAKTDKVIVDAPNASVTLPPPAKKPAPSNQQGGGQ
jgi:modulator of FtsH protease HflK